MKFSKRKKKGIAIGLAVVFIAIGAFYKSKAIQSQKMTPQVGVIDGHLRPCPPEPNCVWSRASDPVHAIAVLAVRKAPEEALSEIEAVVIARGGTLKNKAENYRYFEFKSFGLGFVDDVEFLVDPATNALETRSASRVGYSDVGVNRKRVNLLFSDFEKKLISR